MSHHRPDSDIPDGIVRERRQMFNTKDGKPLFSERRFESEFATRGRVKKKTFPTLQTNQFEPKGLFYVPSDPFLCYEQAIPESKRHPSFVITMRAFLPNTRETNDSYYEAEGVDFHRHSESSRWLIDCKTTLWDARGPDDKLLEEMSKSSTSSQVSSDPSNTMSETSEIMSMHNQIVRYAPSSSASQDISSTSFTVEKEASLVVRLEQELTQAQLCNHRLNQQLKVLANSNDKAIKVELASTKKQLKERVHDVEQLKKAVGKLNTERTMWLSKQPQEVSTLLAEKQELRKQLDREQSEKQELFIQINSMIAKLADSGDQDEINRLKAEVKSLKRELEAEKISSHAEAARLQSELQKTKNEIQSSLSDGDKEKDAMEQEIDHLKNQLSIKNASIQSLMLAKSDSTKINKITEENQSYKLKVESLQQQLNEMKEAVHSKDVEIGRLKESVDEERSKTSQLTTQVETLKKALSNSEEAFSKLKVKLSQFEESALSLTNENDQLKQTQREATLFDGGRIRELTQILNDERDNNAILNVQLREKDGKIDRIQVDILAAESRAEQAEEEVRKLREQVRSAGKSDESDQQVQLLKNEVHRLQESCQLAQKELSSSQTSVAKQEVTLKELEKSRDEARKQLEELNEERRIEVTESKELKLQHEQESHTSRVSRFESEKEQLEQAVEDARKEKEKSERNAAESVSTMKREMTEASINSERELRLSKEQIERLTREVESSKRRNEQLQEDQTKLIGSQDEVKVTLLKDLQSSQAEVDSLKNENQNLKQEIESAKLDHQEAEKLSSELQKQLENTEQKLEEATTQLSAAEDLAVRLQEAQILSGNVESMFSELQKENKSKIEQMVEDHRKEVQKLLDELEKGRNEHSSLETVLEEQQSELVRQRKEAEALQDQLREEAHVKTHLDTTNEKLKALEMEKSELNRKIDTLVAELAASSTRADETERKLIEQVNANESLMSRIEKLGESVTDQDGLKKKMDTLVSELSNSSSKTNELENKLEVQVKENESLKAEVERLSENLNLTKTKLEEAEIERRNELEESNRRNDAKTDAELKELSAENVRLAGELLKFHGSAEKSLQEEKERMSKQFEERLKATNIEKTRLASELQMAEANKKTLQNQVDELQLNLETAEKRRRADLQQLDYLREELHQQKSDNEKLKSNPVAPPRSSTRTISNMSAMTNWTQADFSDCEDLTRLRSEIDKQKRLIIVLRRKLQGLQQ